MAVRRGGPIGGRPIVSCSLGYTIFPLGYRYLKGNPMDGKPVRGGHTGWSEGGVMLIPTPLLLSQRTQRSSSYFEWVLEWQCI